LPVPFAFLRLATVNYCHRDGKTPETAFKVISVDEEYALLREIGAKVKEQSLVGPCDKMQVERNDKEYTFYFDVRIPLRALRKSLESK
jgi:hypothetical protein